MKTAVPGAEVLLASRVRPNNAVVESLHFTSLGIASEHTRV